MKAAMNLLTMSTAMQMKMVDHLLMSTLKQGTFIFTLTATITSTATEMAKKMNV